MASKSGSHKGKETKKGSSGSKPSAGSGRTPSEYYNADNAKSYFGFDPLEFIEDLYNACDDYINDGMDELQHSLQMALKHKRERKSRKRKDVEETEIEKNISKGCDRMVEKLRRIFDRNIDRFEVYTQRNIFNVPEHIAHQAQNKEGSRSDRERNRQEDSGGEDRIEALRQKIREQRRKHRTLLFLKKLYERRIPQLEEKAQDIYAATMALKGENVSREDASAPTEDTINEIKEKVTQIVDQTQELRGVCARLAVSADTEEDTSQSSKGTSKDSESTGSRLSFGELRSRYYQDVQKAAGTGASSSNR